jgi:hypothetical protein
MVGDAVDEPFRQVVWVALQSNALLLAQDRNVKALKIRLDGREVVDENRRA